MQFAVATGWTIWIACEHLTQSSILSWRTLPAILARIFSDGSSGGTNDTFFGLSLKMLRACVDGCISAHIFNAINKIVNRTLSGLFRLLAFFFFKWLFSILPNKYHILAYFLFWFISSFGLCVIKIPFILS